MMSSLSSVCFSSASNEGSFRIYVAEIWFLVDAIPSEIRVRVRDAFDICGWSSRPYIRVLDVVMVNTLTRLHV